METTMMEWLADNMGVIVLVGVVVGIMVLIVTNSWRPKGDR
jgi:uncharacterized membrane-anchored protein YhcB (DUF1043 family)